MSCKHYNFSAQVNVFRMHDGIDIDKILEAGAIEEPEINSYLTEIRVKCADCGLPFQFLGNIPMGVSFKSPTVSIDRLELRQPIQPLK